MMLGENRTALARFAVVKKPVTPISVVPLARAPIIPLHQKH
jgi:hypothetical protein